MSIGRHTLLFFDAAALMAAAGSPSGGSGFLLSLADRGTLRGAVSPGVLAEATRNVASKMGPVQIATLRSLVVQTPLAVTPVPSAETENLYSGKINNKDLHVVAAAIEAKADFLITLDRPLVEEAADAGLPISVLTPQQFIVTQLPSHPDYPLL
jgi:predicted nucleic acid-binding protein